MSVYMRVSSQGQIIYLLGHRLISCNRDNVTVLSVSGNQQQQSCRSSQGHVHICISAFQLPVMAALHKEERCGYGSFKFGLPFTHKTPAFGKRHQKRRAPELKVSRKIKWVILWWKLAEVTLLGFWRNLFIRILECECNMLLFFRSPSGFART